MTENFNAWMQSVQSAVEKALSDLLPSENRFPEQLHKAMRYAVLDGGKRIRPLLVFATGMLFGARVPVMAQAAAAVEMIHAYSLIHDDRETDRSCSVWRGNGSSGRRRSASAGFYCLVENGR